MNARITRWLATTSSFAFSVFAVAVAFSCYFAMYAFRKPFSAASFEGEVVFGDFALKTALLISQTFGYALSKFLGIKFVTELPPSRRALALLGLIGVSEAALLAFAVLPPVGQMVAMFVNGLPLGMIWGLVFSFLEGRRTSDALGAGLSASYILASGAVKSVGRWLIVQGVPESWMPVTTGLLFVPVILATTWLLSLMPPPNASEEALRTRRTRMTAKERHAFFYAFAPGLTLITFMAMVLTAFRDVRDNFAREVWDALGYAEAPAVFTLSEIPVTVAVLLALGLVVMIRSDRGAFLLQMTMMLGGMVLILLSTFLFDAALIGGAAWMVLIGIGLYVAYVPPGCFLFDRLIGATRFVGTAMFMIFVTDAFGYAAAVGVLVYRQFFEANLNWLSFLRLFSYVTGVVGTVAFGIALVYFARRTRPEGA
jgi:hypothetical protein